MKVIISAITQATIFMALVMLTACGAPDEARNNRITIAASDAIINFTASDSARPEPASGTSPRYSSNSASIAAKLMGSTERSRPKDRETTEPTVLVSGTVTFENVTPITSATVELWQDGVTSLGHPHLGTRLDLSPVNDAGHYSVSGADGTGLRLEVHGVSRAIADLPAPTDKTTAPRVRRLTQDFLLPATHNIAGRVLDTSDNPVSGALVGLRSEDAFTDGWYYGNQQTTSTATGEFMLAGVAKGNAAIGAMAKSYTPATSEISIPTSSPVILRLTTGTSAIAGHIFIYPDDSPAAGSTIMVSSIGKEFETLGLTAGGAASAVVAATGTFKLDNLSPGKNMINLKDTNGNRLYAAPGEPKDLLQPTLADNETTAMSLRVFPGYTISGLVHDKDTSEPLSGAKVHTNIDTKAIAPVESGTDGRYVLDNVPPADQISVTATYPGFQVSDLAAARSNMPGSQLVRVQLHTGSAEATQDISMIAIVRVSGRVENKQGLPIANATVQLEGSVDQSDKSVITDVDGRFTLDISPFQQGIIQVSAKGYARHRVEEQLQVSNEDINGLVIVLNGEAVVEGVVVSPEGNPVGDARISLEDNKAYSLGSMMSMSRSRAVGKSQIDGSFRIAGLPSGSTSLSANADGYSDGKTDVNLAEGEHKTGVEIKMSEELLIEGRVVKMDDTPVKASVIPFGPGKATATDNNGYFKLVGVKSGETHILVTDAQTNEKKSVHVKAGVRDLIIRMDEGRITVKGKVVDLITGRPIETFKVELRDGSSPETDSEGLGRFRFTMSPETSNRAVISAEGYKTKTYYVKPDEGVEVHEQTFELGTGAGVSGRVVSAGSGDPVPNLPVTAHEFIAHIETPDGSTITDSGGKFTISNLPSGKTKVVAVPSPPMARSPKFTELVDGEVTDMGNIEIGDAAAIKGLVVKAATGEPVAESMVWLNHQNEGAFGLDTKQTDAEGQFSFSDLAPGRYALTAGNLTETLELKYGETREVKFEIGSVTMRGTITRGGAIPEMMVRAKHVESGHIARGKQRENGSYVLSSLRPGLHEIHMGGTAFDQGTSGSQHIEMFDVPDQEEVQKDFLVPDGPAF